MISSGIRCDFLFPIPAISAEGDVTICCHDMLHKLRLGNVLEEGSLRKVLRSERFQKALAAGQKGKLEICRGCN